MIRHRYSNCTVCHVSPTGGGLLSAYGRALSVEALSTWGTENEGNILHGLVNTEAIPAWLNIGGDVRALQLHAKDANSRRGRFMVMQADLEGAVTIGPLLFVSTIGLIYERPEAYSIGSRRYYAMYQVTDEVHVRAGRYLSAFGLNIPEHTSYTRGELGFGANEETYNIEVGLVNETISAFLTSSQARPEQSSQSKEQALSAQFDYTFLSKYRVGIGRWQGIKLNSSRVLTSVHGALGFTDRIYFLFDLVYQEQRSPDIRGYYVFTRPGWEVFKGFHTFGVLETLQGDVTSGSSIKRKLGLGFMFYPRPHFDFQLQAYKEQGAGQSTGWTDTLLMIFHYWI